MRQARSPRNRLRAVSPRARLPSKDPQIAARTRNQQVDEQALSSFKKSRFQSADDFYGSKGAQELARASAGKQTGRPINAAGFSEAPLRPFILAFRRDRCWERGPPSCPFQTRRARPPGCAKTQ